MNKQMNQMQCSPKCTYFPNMEVLNWEYDNNNLKRRSDGKKYICGYDGHLIKNWYDICPLKNLKKE